METGVPLPLLADPRGYVACRWDLTRDPAQRAWWLKVFRDQLPSLLDHCRAEHADDASLLTMRARFLAYLDACERDPAPFGRLDILMICRERERLLRAAGVADPYASAKRRENEAALPLVEPLLSELGKLDDRTRKAALIEGVFAGNIYDLGAIETIERFAAGGIDFHAIRRTLKPRPWLVDHLDAYLAAPDPKRVVMFVDNAGCDVLLGMLPLALDLAHRGAEVIVTANTHPSLNDITHDELVALVERIPSARGRLRLIPSGNDAPLIDLMRVSPELAAAVAQRPVDLLILEGMGRAIESNYDAAFTCPTLKVAMIKDAGVARAMGGAMYDLVLRYDEPVQ